MMPWHKRIDWTNTLFLVINTLAALIITPIYFANEGFHFGLLIFALIFAAATNLSITAGYHRLFAHRSYEAHPLIRTIYLLVSASAFQGSALKWSADHRKHHGKVDTENDPYSIRKGFWYAHMGWLFLKESATQIPHAPDLEKDVMVRLQNKYYIPLAVLMGFGLPAGVGYLMGVPFGGLIIAGALRIALTQQSTFFVNSLSHTLGRQTYTEENSARDSIIVAILTHGEGYHNYHHKFQIDYRNGIRWYHWDPTKWTIRALALIGLATKLRRISEHEILKARLHMDELRLKSKGFSDEKLLQMKERILAAQISYKNLKTELKIQKSEWTEQAQIRINQIKTELALAKIEFHYGLKQWQACVRSLGV